MAKRIDLINVTCYDNDGGLSWSWNGSEWLSWYEWQRSLGVNIEAIAQNLRDCFEEALESALKSGEESLKSNLRKHWPTGDKNNG